MSCFSALTADQKEKNKKSKKFDNMLNSLGKAGREEIKLLLLGPGESGKSTIFKQMKIISSGGGFTDEDLACFRPIIYSNCITQIQVLISAMKALNIEFQEAANKTKADKIAQLSITTDSWSPEIGKDIEILWADAGIQTCFKDHHKEYQINDSASYFFDNIHRFIDPNFKPTEQDVLRARVRTTGIEEAEFEMDSFNFRMLDVGGQRSERRKWIHCFDCVTCVLFCTSLSEYDQMLREDDSQNRMKESLLLFEEIKNSPWFKTTPFMLFLNKTDLFHEKIQRVPLTVCFPDCKAKGEEECKAYIQKKFLDTDAPGSSTIFTHYTCAVDTENVKFVFVSVRSTILDQSIGTAFLM